MVLGTLWIEADDGLQVLERAGGLTLLGEGQPVFLVDLNQLA